jgi:hypothetical protein
MVNIKLIKVIMRKCFLPHVAMKKDLTNSGLGNRVTKILHRSALGAFLV